MKEHLFLVRTKEMTNSVFLCRSLRLSNFRGCARLSLDFNTKHYAREDMQSFLDDTAGYMRTFMELDV